MLKGIGTDIVEINRISSLYKALGTYCDGKSYTEFSILNDENGKPYLDKPQLEDIHLSLSHCEQYAVAFVVVESN